MEKLVEDPNSRVFAPLAEAYRKSGMLDEAIQVCLEGLKIHPTYISGRVALARAYYEEKMLGEAKEEFEKEKALLIQAAVNTIEKRKNNKNTNCYSSS